jgi:hypothetical protein
VPGVAEEDCATALDSQLAAESTGGYRELDETGGAGDGGVQRPTRACIRVSKVIHRGGRLDVVAYKKPDLEGTYVAVAIQTAPGDGSVVEARGSG